MEQLKSKSDHSWKPLGFFSRSVAQWEMYNILHLDFPCALLLLSFKVDPYFLDSLFVLFIYEILQKGEFLYLYNGIFKYVKC